MDGEVRYLKLTIEYDGTCFHGFQKQGNLRTVQSEIEMALGKVFGHSTRCVAAGRTDAGVHAKGQVISVKCGGSIAIAQIARAANSLLPADLSVSQVCEVDSAFDANRSVKQKTYRYYIVNDAIRSPFCSRYAYDVSWDLDAARMARAAGHFVGYHDFSAFRAAHSAVKTSTRTVYDARVWTEDLFRKVICFEVTANGFLYNMVRIMTGTLLKVGTGRVDPDDIIGIIDSKERSRAGPTVPPVGLWLWEVRY